MVNFGVVGEAALDMYTLTDNPQVIREVFDLEETSEIYFGVWRGGKGANVAITGDKCFEGHRDVYGHIYLLTAVKKPLPDPKTGKDLFWDKVLYGGTRSYHEILSSRKHLKVIAHYSDKPTTSFKVKGDTNLLEVLSTRRFRDFKFQGRRMRDEKTRRLIGREGRRFERAFRSTSQTYQRIGESFSDLADKGNFDALLQKLHYIPPVFCITGGDSRVQPTAVYRIRHLESEQKKTDKDIQPSIIVLDLAESIGEDVIAGGYSSRDLIKLARKVNVIRGNKNEVETFCKKTSLQPYDIVKKILLTPSGLIKTNKYGALSYYCDDRHVTKATIKHSSMKRVDTTGAGDAHTGYFSFGLARLISEFDLSPKTFHETVQRSSAVSLIVLEHKQLTGSVEAQKYGSLTRDRIEDKSNKIKITIEQMR